MSVMTSHDAPADAPPPYPRDFAWGVSTAGYQVEGGLNGPGEPRNNWAAWEDAGRVERTGRGAAFWERWEEDLDLAHALGINAFRMGLEWARLEPTATSGLDPAALDRYADILAGAMRRGLEPVVTLQHFTHPEWLGTDPWLDPATPARFAAYAREVASALGRRLEDRGHGPIRFWVTVNEPNALCLTTYYLGVFPRGRGRGGARDLSAALAGILSAHVHARRALREAYLAAAWPEPTVTYNAWACAVYAVDRYLVDILRPATRHHVHELRREHGRSLGRVGIVGRLADLVLTRAVKRAAFTPLIAELGPDEDALDVLAFDYYHPFLGDYLGWTGPKKHPWEWPASPERMPGFTESWLGPHRGTRLYVLENGIGTRPAPHRGHHRPDRLSRERAIAQAIDAIDRCVARGLDVAGYFHWSLVDNYEWGSFAPRFGLHGVDHAADARRLPTDITGADAAGAYRALVTARRAPTKPTMRNR